MKKSVSIWCWFQDCLNFLCLSPCPMHLQGHNPTVHCQRFLVAVFVNGSNRVRLKSSKWSLKSIFRPQNRKNEISEISPRQKVCYSLMERRESREFPAWREENQKKFKRSSQKVLWVTTFETSTIGKTRPDIHAVGALQLNAWKRFKVSTFCFIQYQEIWLINKMLLSSKLTFNFSF